MSSPGLAPAGGVLSAYRPDSTFVFSTSRGTLLAEGVYFAVPHSVRPAGLADLPARVSGSLRVALAAGHERPIVVGAVPFAPEAAACLAVPVSVRQAPAPSAAVRQAAPPPDRLQRAEPFPTPDAYRRAVAGAVADLRAGRLEKVVLARTLRLPFHGDLAAVLSALAAHDPSGYAYSVPLPGDRTLLGASPELLVSRTGTRVVATPMAGSLPRSCDPAPLLGSRKDRHEHALVVAAVAEALRPHCRSLTVPAEPSLTATATMWHLATTVTGELAGPETTSLTLAAALHPTPAVGGVPTDDALRVIGELEPFDRGFYAGMVGWEDASGDGEWAVTLRCAVADGATITLFAGAGIVTGSDPEAELAETSAKFATALRAMGLADV
ncbi:isochorismate synthase [Nonomuraea soli]|uniref:isochorismate synthase n=1 Tax=Nonomuraea soli TaxID=1032476 RepID=A0A7W0HS76_9ACTN|nr:isochorismate synthase [Nonomuraea soli]MBA2893602.1 isochorismate synthase [Nonomuraea soli]